MFIKINREKAFAYKVRDKDPSAHIKFHIKPLQPENQ